MAGKCTFKHPVLFECCCIEAKLRILYCRTAVKSQAPPWVSTVDALVQFATPPASLTPEYSQLVKSMELSVRDPVGCIDFILRLCTSVVVLTGQDTSRLFAGRLESAGAGAGAGLGARPYWALLPEAKASRSKMDSIPAAFSAMGRGWIARLLCYILSGAFQALTGFSNFLFKSVFWGRGFARCLTSHLLSRIRPLLYIKKVASPVTAPPRCAT